MATVEDLIANVDAAFATTARGLPRWPDPHPGRSPLDEEYSRLSDPAKWRILSARADAWTAALIAMDLATADQPPHLQWQAPPPTRVSRIDRITPHAPGALPLVLARSELGAIADTGVTLGVGRPPTCVAFVPQCGCDACDTGSQDALEALDEFIVGIISGSFRRLSSRDREITVFGGQGWSATGDFRAGQVEAILADPRGWDELTGGSWLPGP